MKKVLLLGDSIRMGYQSRVREKLHKQAEVFYDEKDNGRFACYTLWQANQMFKKYGKMDIVHFNNGYWDMNIEEPMMEPIHNIEEYTHYLRRIIHLSRRFASTVIFATTTPVKDRGEVLDNSGTGMRLNYDNAWVKRYNSAAIELMNEEGVFIDDLYSLALTDAALFKCDDNVHHSDVGNDVLSEQVVKIIREHL